MEDMDQEVTIPQKTPNIVIDFLRRDFINFLIKVN